MESVPDVTALNGHPADWVRCALKDVLKFRIGRMGGISHTKSGVGGRGVTEQYKSVEEGVTKSRRSEAEEMPEKQLHDTRYPYCS